MSNGKMRPSAADAILALIRKLPDFEVLHNVRTSYGHMGATIADGVLQAGISYETVVWPRVHRLLTEFPQAKTTDTFYDLLKHRGTAEVLQWRESEKTRRVEGVTEFLKAKGLQTEDDLKGWLAEPAHADEFRRLRGVGPKTLDYFRMLAGIPSVAVDRHLVSFVSMAGLDQLGYDEIREAVCQAAHCLGTDESSLDFSVWIYMSNGGKQQRDTAGRKSATFGARQQGQIAFA